MHTQLILPGEIVDVLSEDYKSPESIKLAGCRNITYIAQNTTRHGIIFWDQPQTDTHILQAFIAESNSNAVYFHQIERHTNPEEALLTFNRIHDYLRRELGQVHHMQSKIVRDHSLDTKQTKGTPSFDKACSTITQINDEQETRITRYVRELQHDKQFLIATTIFPRSAIMQPSYQLYSPNPLQNVNLCLMNSTKSEATSCAIELAKKYHNDLN